MTTLRRAIPGAALSGIILLTGAAPALAGPAASDGTVSTQAAAAVTKAQKLSKLKTMTGNSEASQNNWFAGLGQYRQNKQAIKKYGFNWATDGCSKAPEKIAGGYDFTFPCHRHDFGYRNYKKIAGLTAFKRDHKLRIDKAFLGDMNRACGKKFWSDPLTPAGRKKAKAACLKTAKKYYSAVRSVG
ncbi:phospholipase A2 [Streptomyces adelaidensis]|uniref:phospholipase A2 n=1 Tax=Streptomyces adelaidensis TaxID=2796465 RepID=UPI00190737F4|nr:phospholipase A2 [Streptomyces adelaidensis]